MRGRHPGQAEEDFLRASRRLSRRRTRRLQGFIAALLALVVGLAVVSAAAGRASHATAHQRDIAAGQRDIALSDELASDSEALDDTNATASQLESIAAWGIHHSAQAYYAMLTAAASPTDRDPHRLQLSRVGGVQPRRKNPGHRRLRLHRPAVEPGHRTADPDNRLQPGLVGRVQPGQQDPGHRRRRHGPTVEHGHRTANPYLDNWFLDNWLRPSLVDGVQPGRQDPGHRRHRRHRPAVEPGHRTADPHQKPAPAKSCR